MKVEAITQLPEHILNMQVTLTVKQLLIAIGNITIASAFADMRGMPVLARETSEQSLELANLLNKQVPEAGISELLPMLEELAS